MRIQFEIRDKEEYERKMHHPEQPDGERIKDGVDLGGIQYFIIYRGTETNFGFVYSQDLYKRAFGCNETFLVLICILSSKL